MNIKVFQGENEILDNNIILQNLEMDHRVNSYAKRTIKIKQNIEANIGTTVEKFAELKGDINELNLAIRKKEGGSEIYNELFDNIMENLQGLDTIFFDLIALDLSLFYGMLAKSYQFMNIRILNLAENSIKNHLDIDKSIFYFRLMQEGTSHIPNRVDIFINKLTNLMEKIHSDNTMGYLAKKFDDTSEYTEAEVLKNLVEKNYKQLSLILNSSSDNLNMVLDESKKGMNQNGVNYNIYLSKYAAMVFKIKPQLLFMQGYKDFLELNFKPSDWKDQKRRLNNIKQLLGDMASTEKDRHLSKEKKFSQIKNHVNIIKQE